MAIFSLYPHMVFLLCMCSNFFFFMRVSVTLDKDPHQQPHFNAIISFILFYLFLAALGLPCRSGFSLVSGSGGYSSVTMYRLLIAVSSLVLEHGL